MKYKQHLALIIAFFCFPVITFSQSVREEAMQKGETLDSLIAVAESKELAVDREKATAQVADLFMMYADWDASNVTVNEDLFSKLNIYRDNAKELAEQLPDNERKDVAWILDQAISDLKVLLDSSSFRTPTLLPDYTQAEFQNGSVMQNGDPVFLSDYVWKPSTDNLEKYFGAMDGFYLAPNKVINESGGIAPAVVSQLNSKDVDEIGSIFFNHTNIPAWALDKYDNLTVGGRHFTKYDVDNPGTRVLMNYLMDGTVPLMAGKRYTKAGYLLANEPHWFTAANSWNTGPVSSHTKAKFRTWLATQYTTINDLNQLWGSSFNDFNEVTIDIPISNSLRGTAKWYDWMVFNNYRITEWFTFLKEGIVRNDPEGKVHIKLIPTYWSEEKCDHGLDFEKLVRLQDFSGCDAKVTNSDISGNPQPWMDRYSMEWRNLSMPYDFFRSIRPDQPIYDSETHFVSTVHFRDLHLDPEYVRAAYVLAHLHGLNVSETWLWGRASNGSVSSGASTASFPGSLMQQPKALNAIATTMIDLNAYSQEITRIQEQEKPVRIYYSLASAINDVQYMDNIYALYQELYFEGFPLGFATDSMIRANNLDGVEAIVVYQADRVLPEEKIAIQQYLDQGGTVIIDQGSMKSDQYGRSVEDNLTTGSGSIIYAEDPVSMKTEVLNRMDAVGKLPAVKIQESNQTGPKGCMWRCIEITEGEEYVITALNMGNSRAALDISLENSDNGTACFDLLKGKYVKNSIELDPYESIFFRITDEQVVFPEIEVVKPDTDTDFLAPAEVDVEVDVTISSGTVEEVRLYLGDTYIGTKTTPPYSWEGNEELQSLIADTYQLRIMAISDQGITTERNMNFVVSCGSAVDTTLTLESCGSVTVNGIAYASSGNYQQTLTSTLGCDSLLNLDLTITSIDNTVIQNSEVLVAYETDASYQWLDCGKDNAPIEGETNRQFAASINGNYAVEIIKGDCSSISDCFAVTTLNSGTFEIKNFNIYPNPATNQVHIESGTPRDEIQISLHDLSGRVIQSHQFNHFSEMSMDLDSYLSGMYFLEFKSPSGLFITPIVIK